MSTQTRPIPPGPTGKLISGCADDFKADPLKFIMDCQNDFGNVVPFNFGLFKALLINEPDLIQEVLVSQTAKFNKDIAIKNNRNFFGRGLLSSEGEYWKRERKLTSHSFSPKKLEGYSQTMVEHTSRMLQQWQDGQIIDIQHEMMYLTLAIAMKTLFDAELNNDNKELEKALTDGQKYLAERMNDPLILMLPEWMPFPTNLHLNEAIEKVNRVVYQLIEERRGHTEGKQDLLSTLLEAKDDDSSGLSNKQIRDEVFTLFFAGHETTALTLTWTLYLLSQNPEAENNLVAELKQVLAGRNPSIADYSSLLYTEKVIKESLRLRPPVWAIGREAISDCVIGNYAIKKGTVILLSQWLMHRDKRYYQNPEQFNPDRWTHEFMETLPKFAYFPFGGGPRICIGNGFAMIEAVLALASILQSFHLKAITDQPVGLLPAVTLRPARRIQMRLERR